MDPRLDNSCRVTARTGSTFATTHWTIEAEARRLDGREMGQ